MSEQTGPAPEEAAGFWRDLLVEGKKPVRLMRSVFRRVPAAPRCKFCLAPFGSVGGRVLALSGFAPSRKNPLFCNG